MKGASLTLSLALASWVGVHDQGSEIQVAAGTSVTQLVPGQTAEIRAYAEDLVIQSVEVTPPEGVSVQQIRETTPDPSDRRQHRARVKVWAIAFHAEPTATLGERTFVIVASGRRSDPHPLRVLTHLPKISDLKVLSAESKGVKIRFAISILDDAQDVDWRSIDGRAFLFCHNAASGFSFDTERVEKKDAKTTVAYLALVTAPDMTGTGLCRLSVHIKDKLGTESNRLEGDVTFQ